MFSEADRPENLRGTRYATHILQQTLEGTFGRHFRFWHTWVLTTFRYLVEHVKITTWNHSTPYMPVAGSQGGGGTGIFICHKPCKVMFFCLITCTIFQFINDDISLRITKLCTFPQTRIFFKDPKLESGQQSVHHFGLTRINRIHQFSLRLIDRAYDSGSYTYLPASFFSLGPAGFSSGQLLAGRNIWKKTTSSCDYYRWISGLRQCKLGSQY